MRNCRVSGSSQRESRTSSTNLLVVVLGGASQALENLPPSHDSRDTLQDVVRAGERAAELTRKMLAYAGKANLYMEPTDLNKLVRDTCDSAAKLRSAGDSDQDLGRARFAAGGDRFAADAAGNCGFADERREAIREGSAGTISVRTARTEVGRG